MRKRYRDLPRRFFAHFRVRDVLLCAAVWLLLTALGTWEGYRFTTTLPENVSLSHQRLHNLLDGVLLHGRIVGKLVRERVYPISDVGMPLTMHAVGWGCWCVFACLWLTIRRGLLAKWTRRLAQTQASNDASTALADAPDASNEAAPEADRPLTQRTITRRRMLIDVGTGATLLAGTGLAYDAFVYEPFAIQLRKYTIAIRDLPASLSGLRLVQLTDTHVGRRVPAAYVRAVAQQAAALKPDVVLLTGDYVHSGDGHVRASIEAFAPVFDLGVPTVAVLGNHDWYGGSDAIKRELSRHKIPLLDNTRLYLDAATRTLLSNRVGDSLCIAGLGDYLEDRIYPSKALGDCPPDMPRILLSHNPDAAEDKLLLASKLRVDLMISGHTHGGQVRLPFLGTPIVPSKFGSKYAGGLVQGPAFPVLVCRGIGMSLIPVRWNVPPELVEITLVRAL